MTPHLEEIPASPNDLRQTIEDIIRDVNARQQAAPQRVALIRAAPYERVSRVIAGEESYSISIQADKAVEYARTQSWTIVDTFEDPNFSGKNSRRPGLLRLTDSIKAGRVDVVVVHRLDRLYRNLEALLKFLRFLRRCHVRLVSVTEHIDTDTYWGVLVLQVMGSIAEMYVRYASEYTRAAKHQRVSRGLPNGSPYRFGYCNGKCSRCTDPNGVGYCPLAREADRGDGRVLIPHPIESHAVRLIHELYHRGWSYADVAVYLNDNDFNLAEGA
jgi:DNA invertase Pin-like site-specific DNA recombinase